MSANLLTQCFAQRYELIAQELFEIDNSRQPASRAQPADLLIQIKQAFEKPPGLARILHGDRKILQGSRGRRTALFPSSKCRGSVPLESRLELAHAVVLERTFGVYEYRTQAIRISLPGGGFAYPDFLIQTIDGRFEVHEVKPSAEYLPNADVERFKVMKNLLNQVGVAFRLIDTQSLPTQQVLEALLQHYARGHLTTFSRMQIELAKSLLAKNGFGNPNEAYRLMTLHELPEQIIDYLIFHQQLPLEQQGANGYSLGGYR